MIIIVFCIFFIVYIHIHITSQQQWTLLIQNNPSHFSLMNTIDLELRDSETIQEYTDKYIQFYESFTLKQCIILYVCRIYIQFMFYKYNKIREFDWRFSKISTKSDLGYSHTIHNTIVISDNFFDLTFNNKIRVLLHECIHIIQKNNILKTQQLYSDLDFYKKNIDLENRWNPDTDKINYEFNNKLITCHYIDNPETINDIKKLPLSVFNTLTNLNINTEHPNEILADIISNSLIHNIPMNYAIINYLR